VGRRYELSRPELEAMLAALGEPRYRAAQLWHGLYRRLADPAELTELPASLRETLARCPELRPSLVPRSLSAAEDGSACKWAFGLDDGSVVETVLLRHRGHSTVCVSTQAGCAMGCRFCATGQAGFRRHLSTGEIVEQVVWALRASADGRQGPPLRNVVFMGMGEPLANCDRVLEAIARLRDDLRVSPRRITVSTVGIVPGIRRLAETRLPVGLAWSLHAADDELRDRLVPINRRYPIAAVADACRDWSEHTGRRLSLEWTLIDGVNDRPDDAARLAALARSLRAHVNLIPCNRTPGFAGRASPPAAVAAFAAALRARQVNVTVRATKGAAIDAACGQLAGVTTGSARGLAD
jgi:23S rRNA (adenine2503-C2)-methyltransferase